MAPTKEKTTEINSAASIPKTDVTKSEDTEKANPTCLSDYTKCRDNEELVDRHRITKPGVCFDGCMLVTLCRRATDDASPYGDPELPWLGKFGRYRLGRSFIETGLAELVETDARVPNVFGTKVKKIIRCSVDLRSGRAIVAFD